MERETALLGDSHGMAALLTRGPVASAVALALKPFLNSLLSPAEGHHGPCSSLLSEYSPYSQAFLLFEIFFFPY